MKLPKNPTEAQILAVTGLVIKSIYTRGTVAVQTLDLDSQGRLTGIFLGDGVRFRYTIDNGILSYAPVNPKDLPSEEGISLSEDALDFARLKIAGNTKQEKKCKVGYACGYSCISQNRNCKKALRGQAKNAVEWLEMQQALSGESKTYKGTLMAVLEVEDKIRNQRFESLAVFDKDGNRILFKDGEDRSVDITFGEAAKMKDAIVTHNHPPRRGYEFKPGHPLWMGSSFSPEDLRTAASTDLAEIRAVSNGYRHSMKRPENGWPAREKMMSIVEEAVATETKAGWARIDAAKTDEERAKIIEQEESRLWHDVSLRVTKVIGAEYTREDWRPNPKEREFLVSIKSKTHLW